jgi:hypothetical protein
MTSAVRKKSGKGLSDGVISELAACFDVLPGHDEELRAAVRRFTDVVRDLDPETGIRTGLRDTRHVVFDAGRRLLWCTTFENDWDAYIDECLLLIGIEPFLDWMRHTTQGRTLAWVTPALEVENDGSSSPEVEEIRRTGTRLKAILQSVQTPAAAYFNPLGPLTLPQIITAQRLVRTFRQVLGNPAAEEVLKHPALRPLLRQAAALKLSDVSGP